MTNAFKVREAIKLLNNVLDLTEKLVPNEDEYFDSYSDFDNMDKTAKGLKQITDDVPDIDDALEHFKKLYEVCDIIVLMLIAQAAKREAVFNKLIADSNQTS